MDFLTTLYSNDNFGIILFITISILVLAFLVILFFGKKDQKERELAATKSVELNNGVGQVAFQDTEPQKMMDIPIPPIATPTPIRTMEPNPMNQPMQQPPIPPIMNEPPINSTTQVVPQKEIQIPPVQMEPNIQPMIQNNFQPNQSVPPIYKSAPIKQNPTPTKPSVNNNPVYKEKESTVPKQPLKTDFDFDALAASISKELKSLENSKPIRETKPRVENTPSLDETIRIPTFEPKEMPSNRGPIPPIKKEIERMNETSIMKEQPERKPISNGPTQFSSVFVSKNQMANTPSDNEKENQPIESMAKAAPVKPNIELPKTIDLPKLNGVSSSNNASKIVFSGLENDIPTYNKNNENRM